MATFLGKERSIGHPPERFALGPLHWPFPLLGTPSLRTSSSPSSAFPVVTVSPSLPRPTVVCEMALPNHAVHVPRCPRRPVCYILIVCFPLWNMGHEGGALDRSRVPRWCLPELRGPRSPPTQPALSWGQPGPRLVTAFPDTFSSSFCAALCPSPRLARLLPPSPWLLPARPVSGLLPP